jgi:hypothetical protein
MKVDEAIALLEGTVEIRYVRGGEEAVEVLKNEVNRLRDVVEAQRSMIALLHDTLDRLNSARKP